MSAFISRVNTLSSTLRPATLALAALALLTTGCANFNDAVTGTTSATQAASLSGNVHGGRQPVVGATVSVWAAGNTGYGSAATKLASTTTDSNGNFSFAPGSGNSYACPASNSGTASQLIYLTSTGGQPTTGITNSAASFLLALGDCSTVLSTQPFVNINEVTTIGSMFALQQFFSPTTEAIGTSATNLQGLKNAFATVNNLVNINTGTANTSLTVTGPVTGYATNPSVTITPESSKINTLADTLAACVNTNGSTAPFSGSATACGTLFSGVNSTAATDTLQAAYYLATNPTSTVSGTSNIASIYALATATSPYQPTLTAAPTDWTIGVSYGTNSTSTAGTYFLYGPEYLAIDSVGDVWVANYFSGSVGAGNSLSELSPTGAPVNQVLTSSLIGPSSIAIDKSNNVYVSNYGVAATLGTTVAEYTAGGATNTFTVSGGPQSVSLDGQDNLFVVSPSYKGAGTVQEIPAGSATGTTATTLATGLVTDFSAVGVDGNYNLWISGGGPGTTMPYNVVYQLPYTAGTTNYPTTAISTTAGGITEPEAIAIDGSNNLITANYSKSTLSAVTGSTTIVAATNSPYTTTNLTKPEALAVDGAGNIWASQAASGGGATFEYSSIANGGGALSPAAGFVHYTGESYGIAIDGSGNVWIGNYTAKPTASVQGYITEIVGAAAPVLTPIAAGLPSTPGGTNKLGSRP
ncbi:hypothetical protein SAMN05421770_101379 [Granulicella rosea]|uniref:NHL repeat containing protein n=1 Tax=Granulicella rosea TaxID=474952 RepID=A0A239DB31_9BACT|nr:hypothetical protein [Granulicella rosea]SNS29520.1 hypothetical protein SAMN05421770_101379 [Granulicella rosea]